MVRIATVSAHGLVLATTAFVRLTYQHSSVFERPIQSSIVLLASSGVLFLLLYSSIPWTFSDVETVSHATLPVHEVAPSTSSYSNIVVPWRAIFDLPSHVRRQIIVVALGICLMVGLFQTTLINRQCFELGSKGLLGFVPFALVCYHYVRRREDSGQSNATGFKPSAPERSASFLDRSLLISSAFGLGISAVLARYAVIEPTSTYICPSSSYLKRLAPGIEILNIALICFLLHTTSSLVETPGPRNSNRNDKLFVEGVGYVLITASFLLLLGGFVALISHPTSWQWVFNFDQTYIWSLCCYILLLTAFVQASVRIFLEYGLGHVVTTVTFMTIFATGIKFARDDLGALISPGLILQSSFVLVLCSSFFLYFLSGGIGPWEKHRRYHIKPSKITYPIVFIGALILLWSLRSDTTILDSHSVRSYNQGVPSLIELATTQASAWEKQASLSQTLDESVSEYWRRYQLPPPPGFDAWYRYATSRNSVIIDDYDSIFDDLRPYWGISPAEIRLRTGHVISDTWNEVSEIRIRDGKGSLGPNFQPTHRWMLDSILLMIKDFSHILPDMDLAFNLNDEPRVAVPYTMMQQLEKIRSATNPAEAGSDIQHDWTAHRALQWDPLVEMQPIQPFSDISRLNSFSSATVACPPTSAARNMVFWDPQPLCTSCFAPHSLGPFLWNWTLAASPCHQPDLRNLHGFYLSPAALKISATLLPVFSQSKVAGFADILYPSPWNYVDKAVYAPDNTTHPDPPFAEKENMLFWRGGTSEGISRFGTWQGMARQRLVHLADHPNSATSPILISDPHKTGSYIYDTQPASSPPLPLNMSIVSEIARAWDNDGADQVAEFSLAPPVDFQHHWQYRYLFDTDGAAFSGRFLPFLQSRSLPFRAGIFRTWYDARVTAWRHFVPVDIRLHGLMATLEYFAGRKDGGKDSGSGGGGGGGGGVQGDVASGEKIAEAGREWAAKALRKEDMEIYMFRLLLEWGRITDDRRDELGYVTPK